MKEMRLLGSELDLEEDKKIRIRKFNFIESNILRDKEFANRRKTFVTLMKCGIPKKNTLMRPKFKLMTIVRSKERETRANKGFKKVII